VYSETLEHIYDGNVNVLVRNNIFVLVLLILWFHRLSLSYVEKVGYFLETGEWPWSALLV